MTNLPEGLGPLVTLRLAGKIPSKRITILVGDEWKRPNWNEWTEFLPYPSAVVRTHHNLKTLDLRALKGMAVFIHSVKFDERAAAVLDLAKKFATYILLSVEECGGDHEFIEWRPE